MTEDGTFFPFSPSPGHKLAFGGSRNELFLRSVLSSPYNPPDPNSFTPMSATPSGISPRPVFRTPVTKDQGSPLTHRTPQGWSLLGWEYENI